CSLALGCSSISRNGTCTSGNPSGEVKTLRLAGSRPTVTLGNSALGDRIFMGGLRKGSRTKAEHGGKQLRPFAGMTRIRFKGFGRVGPALPSQPGQTRTPLGKRQCDSAHPCRKARKPGKNRLDCLLP